MYKRIFGVLFFVSVVLNLHAQSVSQKIVLNKGEVFETVTNMTTNMLLEMMGNKTDMKMDYKFTQVTEVKDVNADAYNLTNTIKKVVMNTSGMGQEMTFDSDKPADSYNELGQRMNSMLNKENKVTVDKRGRIVEMHSPDSAANEMISNMLGVNMLNSIKGSQYPLLAVLPAKAVRPGESWTDSVRSSEGMNKNTVNTYTLRSVSGNEITVDIAGKISQEGTVEMQGMSITMNLAGTSKGEAVYDQKTGIMKKDNLDMNMSGTMEVMGQSVPINMTAKSSNEVKKRL